MTWRIRHQGSPRAIEGLTLTQVIDGLNEEKWEQTDEVMGPSDSDWVAIESHPQLAEAVADPEPPPPRFEEDESRLDMNPLIDVALVLLIFFILTTSYAALQKLLEMPSPAEKDDKPTVLQLTDEQVEALTVRVSVKLGSDGKPLIYVEKEAEPVPEDLLAATLKRYAGVKQKNNLLIDAQKGVTWGTIVMIQDAARGADFERVLHIAGNG